jgi:hypothetical protein
MTLFERNPTPKSIVLKVDLSMQISNVYCTPPMWCDESTEIILRGYGHRWANLCFLFYIGGNVSKLR